ncbi:phosphate ABC transporter permease PstA [Brevibacillus humidisoli]|uniref:phosphate ABC transporter permease PstA n=1 Tax=Brevibacillus humidisoli TaxID=2895522 RepID=UPI001E3C6AA3|nr:phosphate ABC transporter permease PstA [Brevibacillus humidisoli]UFJ40932.1 phosphate ABC transporter permease PstA [Brevibacillus humidisoli]
MNKLRKIKDTAYKWVFFAATLFGMLALVVLVIDIIYQGMPRLNWDFINNFPSYNPERSGIKAALWGSIWVIVLTAPMALVLGVSTALYLEEYAKKNWFTRLVQTNISNLAGVPSIIYGILGLALFVRAMSLGPSILAGAFTMALLVLPIVVVAAQEAIRAVPQTLRHGAYALGASKWQTIRGIVLPSAAPGILTGMILSLSRAIGETAPLVVVGAFVFVRFVPEDPLDKFTVLPIQIYSWVSQPKQEFHELAASGIIILLVVLLLMNATAVFLRNKYQKRF